MKKFNLLSICCLTIVLTACTSTKNVDNKVLQKNTWELEYLSGPQIAFEGLFPVKKPQISFNKNNHRVEGNDGCNGYSASYKLEGQNISLGEPGPSTLMYCGEGEKFFRSTIKKIDKWQIDKDGKLILLMTNVAMLRFHKTIAEKK